MRSAAPREEPFGCAVRTSELEFGEQAALYAWICLDI